MRALEPISISSGQSTPINLDPGTDRVLIANESPYSVRVNMTGQVRWLPAWTMDLFALPGMSIVGAQITFMPQTVSSATNAPSTTLLVTLLATQDVLTGVYPCALARQTNIGNGVIPTTGTNNLVNDGSAAGTQIIETTPQGQSTSAFFLDNSGNLTLRTMVASVWSVVFQTVSNGNNVFHGTADSATNATNATNASNVPASGIGSGPLGSGVTIAAGQVTSGNLNIGTGALTTTGGANVGGIVTNAFNAGFEHGSQTSSNTPFIDWHSSGNNIDYDSRIIASGGNSTIGNGNLTMYANNVTHSGSITSDATKLASDGNGWLQANAFTANATHNNGSGNYSFAGTGAVYFENGGVRTNGSGRIISSQWQPSVSGVAFAKLGYFSGTGSGTVSHGAGTTPAWIGITDSQSSSSMTVGVASYTSTQCTVTAGASHTWNGIAL